MKFKTFFFSFLLDTALFITERRKKDILKKKKKNSLKPVWERGGHVALL